jgi:rod shape-determining protein MreC
MKRKPKFVLPTKYILLILSGVCIVAILLSFTLGISGGPLNTVAGYVFIPMQRGINSVGSWIGEKADNLKKLNDVMAKDPTMKSRRNLLCAIRILINAGSFNMDSMVDFQMLKKQNLFGK